jgi:MFS family permease
VVIFFAALLGISTAYSAPASQALIGSLVRREELQSAVALNSMTYNLARAIGPALGGLSVKALGIPASFAINAASYLLLVIGVGVVRPRRSARPPRTGLRDSLELLRANPRLIALLLIVTAVGFGSDPVNTEAPAFAEVFVGHSIDLWAGLIIGAFGLGAVSAAFLLAGRVAGSARRMALTLLLLSGGVAGFAVSPWLGAGFAFLFVAGFGYLASNTSATSRLQLEVEEYQRGRIMALWAVAFLGLRPLASLTDGAVASGFGIRAAGVVLAIPPLVGAGAILLVLRRGVPVRRAAPAPYPPPRV